MDRVVGCKIDLMDFRKLKNKENGDLNVWGKWNIKCKGGTHRKNDNFKIQKFAKSSLFC